MSVLRALRFAQKLALPLGALALAPATAEAQSAPACPPAPPADGSQCAPSSQSRCTYPHPTDHSTFTNCECQRNDARSTLGEWRCETRHRIPARVGPMPPPDLAA